MKNKNKTKEPWIDT